MTSGFSGRTRTGRTIATLGAGAVLAATLVSAVATSSNAAPVLAPTWAIAADGAGAGNVDANGDGIMDPFMSVMQATTTPADANVATDTVQGWTPNAFKAPTQYTLTTTAYADCTGVNTAFEWSVNGVVDASQTGCTATLTVPAVGASIEVTDDTNATNTFTAKPKNFWIVSLGDSFASGEGNPQTCIADTLNPGQATATDCVHSTDGDITNLEFAPISVPGANKTYDPRNNKYSAQSDNVSRTTAGDKVVNAGTRQVTFKGDRWIWQGATYDQPCDRSTWAASALSAMSLEQADPHTSIDYLQLACSGAQMGTGLIYPYKGYSQIAKMQQAIAASGRKPSQVVVSAGGNDAQLVSLLFDCFNGDCTSKKSPAAAKLAIDTVSLPYWISSTAGCLTTTKCVWLNAPKHPKAKATGLKGLSLSPKTITVLSYADLTRANPIGKTPAVTDYAHQRYTSASLFGKTITLKEAAWAYKNVMGGGLTPLMAKSWRKAKITWVDRSPLWGQHGLGMSPDFLHTEANLLAAPNVGYNGGKYGQRWFFGLDTGAVLPLVATNNGAPGGLGHPTAGGLYWAYRPGIVAAAKKLGIS